jgi:hypothetical protein
LVRYADAVVLELLQYASDECAEAVTAALQPAPRLAAHLQHMRGFEHVQAFLGSARRHPPPDAEFVRRVCAILGMPLPKYLRDG